MEPLLGEFLLLPGCRIVLPRAGLFLLRHLIKEEEKKVFGEVMVDYQCVMFFRVETNLVATAWMGCCHNVS